MTTLVHRHETPDRFVAGTVGEPGARTFFLQARSDNRLTSVVLEKQQVDVLADRMASLVARIPSETDDVIMDSDPLDVPIEEEFRVGTMTLAWDDDSARVVLEAYPSDVEDVADAEEALEVHVPLAMARGFVQRAKALVAAGRPSCQFCGGPIDPDGHLCPRANGFRRTGR